MRVARFISDEKGSSAVEFAFVGSLLIFTILFVMIVGLVLYLNQALDYATSKAARQIMIGVVQKNATSQSDFRTKILCPYLPISISCANVIVNVQTVAQGSQPGGYYALVKTDLSGLIVPPLSNASAQYLPGVQGSYEYVQVIYPITFLPGFIATALSGGMTFNGMPAYLALSTAAFRNEQF